jgi:hypothetical protein
MGRDAPVELVRVREGKELAAGEIDDVRVHD